jgi:hypothetical protein
MSPKIGFGVISRIFGAATPFIYGALAPTPLSDGTFDQGPVNPEKLGIDPDLAVRPPKIDYEVPAIPQLDTRVDPLVDPLELKEVPYEKFKVGTPGYTVSPKRSRVIITVPDVMLPPPLVLEPEPTHEIWDTDRIRPEVYFPTGPQVETKPEIGTEPATKPKLSQIIDYGVTITVETKLDTQTQVESDQIIISRTKVRASRRRRKDQKANRRWIKAAHKLINVTYGTYSEIKDLVEAFANNIGYVNENGKWVSAMAEQRGDLKKVLRMYREGHYEIDIGQFILDYAYMQAQDFVIGKSSQLANTAIDKGVWQSPVGPSGFISNTNVGV